MGQVRHLLDETNKTAANDKSDKKQEQHQNNKLKQQNIVQ